MTRAKSEEPQRQCREFANDAKIRKTFAKFAHSRYSRSKLDDLASDFATAIKLRHRSAAQE